jgi:polyphosphate kinase
MTPITDENKRDFFISRELSWLEFNHRVLEEASDPTQPLLERVRFLCITSSNLDEFFEVRVAGIKQQIENGGDEDFYDAGLSPSEIFDAIQKRAHRLVKEQYDLWNREIVPELKKQNIHFHDVDQLSPEDVVWAEHHFQNEIFPVLTPLAVDPSHPFPQLLNKSHNLIVTLRRPANPDLLSYALVQIPRVLPRLVRLPRSGEGNEWHFIILERLIRRCISQLFPGDEIVDVDGFRITRNSDLYIDEEEANNLLQHIEEELRKRNRGNVVRLEIEEAVAPAVLQLLMSTFKITEKDVYTHDGPINFLHIMPLVFHEAFAHLRDRPWNPLTYKEVPAGADLFEIMRRQDRGGFCRPCGRGQECAGHQDDPVSDQRRLPDRACPDPRRPEWQTGDHPGGTQSPF